MRKREKQRPTLASEEYPDDRQLITALVRGLALLRLLAKGEVLGTTDLARLSGLSNSTVSRLCYTLTNLRYVEYLRDIGKYRLGDACLSLGYLHMASDIAIRTARPLMHELATFSRVPVCLGRHHEQNILYTARESVEDRFSLKFEVGSLVPIERTAIGHAYLAGIDDAERRGLLDSLTSRVPDMDRFRRPIEDNVDLFHKKGFCIADKMWLSHIRAVAAPLRLRDSGKVVAFNCGGIADYLDLSFLMNEVGPRLAAVVREIEGILESGMRNRTSKGLELAAAGNVPAPVGLDEPLGR